MVYLDTSALVKLVVAERQVGALREYLRQRGVTSLFSSMLAHAELLRAVQPGGAPAASVARRVLAGLHLVDLTREILEHAGTLQTSQRLTTLDAVHLATAMAAEDRLDDVVSYDTRMLAAAQELGLAVVTP